MTDLSGIAPGTCLTTSDLMRLGLSGTAVRRLLNAHRLRRLTHGVYTVPPQATPQDPFTAAQEEHLLHARALLLTFEGSYLVGPSACVALGLPVLRLPSAVHVSRRRPIHSRRDDVHPRRPWAHDTDTTLAGLPCQSATAAVVEVAALDGHLAGLVSADAAARAGLLTDSDTVLAAWGRRQGIATAREVLARADGRRESPLETEVAFTAEVEGIPLIPQVTLYDEHGGFVARTDFVVDGHRVVVEVDGLSKYGISTHGPDALRQEKLRQSDIERLGWVVVRITARDLRTGRLGHLLRQSIAHADAVFGAAAA